MQRLVTYSDHLYSERQSIYGKRFGLDSVYTPQMVVDGSRQFVGSNPALADKAFAKAVSAPKISVHLSLISANLSGVQVFSILELWSPPLAHEKLKCRSPSR